MGILSWDFTKQLLKFGNCSLDDIIKMHWPLWQSCWWTKMGRKQAEVQHSSVASQFLCQMYFLYFSKVVQGIEFFFFFFFTALDNHPSPEFFLISLHCSGGHLASVYLYAESLLQWTADGRVQHFSAHQSWFICLISNSVLLVVCTLWSWDCASTSVLEKDYIAIQLDLSIQHAAMLTFSFVLGQTITLQQSYISLCRVRGPANAMCFKVLPK